MRDNYWQRYCCK